MYTYRLQGSVLCSYVSLRIQVGGQDMQQDECSSRMPTTHTQQLLT
jgi:hypothetical protein